MSKEDEKALLVAAAAHNGRRLWRAEDSLNELAQLAGTAGIEVEGTVIQKMPRANPVTYVGKDVAYQLWKFGLLGADFTYARFHEYPDGHQLWATRPDGVDPDEAPSFGEAGVVYNVIDVRQSYLQRIVAEGLRVLGYPDHADRSIHWSAISRLIESRSSWAAKIAIIGNPIPFIGRTSVNFGSTPFGFKL